MTGTDPYRLNDQDCARYREDGFVFLPDLIPESEIARARDELAGLCKLTRREVILENDGATVRSVMNPQVFSALFARFVRHPKLLGPARGLSVPMHSQFEIAIRRRHLAVASGLPDLSARR